MCDSAPPLSYFFINTCPFLALDPILASTGKCGEQKQAREKKMAKGVMVKGLNMMVMMTWMMMMPWMMMMKMGWIMFRRSPFSWPLKLLEQMWVRFVFIFLKYEMETISARYVIPFEYYKVQPCDKL
ncbi:hypothetical protein R6Q57_002018 [Mikania cordata]